MDSEQETAARVDLDVLMEQMRGYPPTRIAEAVWGWMEAQGFREKAHTPTDDEQEAMAQWLHLRFGKNQTLDWDALSDRFKTAWRDLAGDAPLRRSEVPEPSAEDAEFAPGECDGSGKCEAERHIHGCYTPHRADQCDAPEEYGHLPTKPQGEPTVIRCGGGCGAELETTDPVNRRAAYLCPRCLETEVNRAAGGVR